PIIGEVGCAEQKGGLMLAVSTDMKAPKDVSIVSVTISTNNKLKHNFIGRVTPDGEVKLPATLAIAEPDDRNASIRIRVVAFQERKPRVLRDVRTSIPHGGRVALLRIPMNFVDDGSGQGQLPKEIFDTLGRSSSPIVEGPTGGDGGVHNDAGASGGS